MSEEKLSLWQNFKWQYKQSKRMRLYMGAVSGISLMFPLPVYFFMRDNAATILKFLFGFMLLLFCVVSFIEANTIANEDIKKRVGFKDYKLKGFVLGLLAQLPMWIAAAIVISLKGVIIADVITPDAANYISNFLILQYTDIMLLFDYSIWGYIISFLILPVVSMIGYLLAYFKIDIDDALGGIHK